MDANTRLALDTERDQRKARLRVALTEEEDPLALYQEFIEWTIKSYKEQDSRSRTYILELLREATNQFKTDPVYRTDLRYLKMWTQYAARLNDKKLVAGVFGELVKNGIGTAYALLYMEFTNVLEKEGRLQEADAVYKKGIEIGARPLEKLKAKYREFQTRVGSSLPSSSSMSGGASSSQPTGKNTTRKDRPMKRLPASATSRSVPTPAVSGSKAGPSTSSTGATVYQSTGPWYSLMLAPPDPGKRPEKLRFKLPLLFTEDKVEYSIQEARARSMGLLGKKWGPPPPSEMRRSSPPVTRPESPQSPNESNDDTPKLPAVVRYGKGGRKSMLPGAEPTMTINTKEALADVFGMYNGQDPTMKMVAVPQRQPSSALKKIESGPSATPFRQEENENAPPKASAVAFRPFVDENGPANRSTPGKFKPFVDTEPSKTPAQGRSVLGKKSTPGPSDLARSFGENSARATLKSKPISEEPPTENVFSRVFSPEVKLPPLAPLRDAFTDDHGKPQPKPKTPSHQRPRSYHDIVPPSPDREIASRSAPVFTPYVDESERRSFRVFSPPPDSAPAENSAPPPAVTPKPVFTPFTDSKPPFTPFRDERPPPSASSSVTPQLPPLPLQSGSGSSFQPYTDSDSSTDGDEHAHIPIDSAISQLPPQQQWAAAGGGVEDDDDSESDQYQEEYAQHHEQEHYDDDQEMQYEEEESFQEEIRDMPLGGRFGRINVMTPITERTYEFTSTRSGFGNTPNQRLGYVDEDEDYDEAGSMLGMVDEHGAAQIAEEFVSGRSVSPFRLSEEDGASRRERHQDTESVFGDEATGSMSLNDTLPSGPKFKPPNPCNPFDPPIQAQLLSKMSSKPNFVDLRDRDSGMLSQLEKFTKKAKKDSTHFPVELNGQKFNVSEKLGEGGFGSVFKARDKGMKMDMEGDDEEDDDEDEDEDYDEDEGSSFVALKVVKPCNVWEYHVLLELHDALPQTARRSLILPHALYAFQDESILILEYCSQGMLLNIVNNAVKAGVSQAGGTLDELLIMFFSIELLRLVESMHNVGFIHGDLKIDNCLLRLEDVPGDKSAWTDEFQPSGEGGWSCKGLKLIDFGRSIDTRVFPPGQEFIADWATDDRDCFEIREDRPWTYQADYFGLAGIIYCMLYGKYIQENSVVLAPSSPQDNGKKRYKLSTPMKRYWQTEIWSRLFDILLNPTLVRPDGSLPLCDELAEVRRGIEEWLQSKGNRATNTTLKGLLKKVERHCISQGSFF